MVSREVSHRKSYPNATNAIGRPKCQIIRIRKNEENFFVAVFEKKQKNWLELPPVTLQKDRITAIRIREKLEDWCLNTTTVHALDIERFHKYNVISTSYTKKLKFTIRFCCL